MGKIVEELFLHHTGNVSKTISEIYCNFPDLSLHRTENVSATNRNCYCSLLELLLKPTKAAIAAIELFCSLLKVIATYCNQLDLLLQHTVTVIAAYRNC
jgi:hypothetical protein